MCLSGCQGKAERPAGAIDYDAGLGGKAATSAGQELHAHRAVLKSPLFGRTRGFLVRPDGGAVEEGHPQLHPGAVLRFLQQTLPHTAVAPAVEGLRGHPPRSQVRR